MAYGAEIKNSSNNLVMLSTSRLQSLVIAPGSVTIVPGTSLENSTEVIGTGNYQKAFIGTSGNISFPGLTSSNTADFQIWITDLSTESQANTIIGRFKKVYIERDTNQFRLRLETWFSGSSGAETYRYMGFRF